MLLKKYSKLVGQYTKLIRFINTFNFKVVPPTAKPKSHNLSNIHNYERKFVNRTKQKRLFFGVILQLRLRHKLLNVNRSFHNEIRPFLMTLGTSMFYKQLLLKRIFVMRRRLIQYPFETACFLAWFMTKNFQSNRYGPNFD